MHLVKAINALNSPLCLLESLVQHVTAFLQELGRSGVRTGLLEGLPCCLPLLLSLAGA